MRFAWALLGGLAAVTAAALSGPAAAETYTIQQIGAWRAFGGTDHTGVPTCGVVNLGTEGRAFVIKTWSNVRYFAVQIFKTAWRIPKGQTIAIELQFDSYNPWRAHDGIAIPPNGVQFQINPNAAERFMSEFGQANRVIVRFPTGTERPWEGGLTGTAAMTQILLQCVAKMRGGSTQPYGGSPTQPYGTPNTVTQPFGNNIRL
jgi:hypothetical protein